MKKKKKKKTLPRETRSCEPEHAGEENAEEERASSPVEVAGELEELRNRLAYLAAEFDNYRKRVAGIVRRAPRRRAPDARPVPLRAAEVRAGADIGGGGEVRPETSRGDRAGPVGRKARGDGAVRGRQGG